MTKLMDPGKARMMGVTLSFGFLFIHILLYLLFTRYGVKPMAVFNLFSMLFYVGMLVLAEKGKFRFFSVAVYVEVVAHMSAAVYFTGWESGFQNTLIGMSILLFYSEYIGRHINVRFARSAPLSLLGMAAYLALCVVDHRHEPAYPLPGEVAFVLQIAWGVVVFSITIFSLYTFSRLTYGSERLLSEEVNHDQLTGLANRYYVADYLHALEEGGGLEGYWAAMLDIDDFKCVNDTYGHNCGDYVLTEIADILRANAAGATVARWGGEEFLLLGQNGDGAGDRAEPLNALREKVMRHPFVFEGRPIAVTVTMGIADYRPGSSIHEWLGAADHRLYEGKNRGKNLVVAE